MSPIIMTTVLIANCSALSVEIENRLSQNSIWAHFYTSANVQIEKKFHAFFLLLVQRTDIRHLNQALDIIW